MCHILEPFGARCLKAKRWKWIILRGSCKDCKIQSPETQTLKYRCMEIHQHISFASRLHSFSAGVARACTCHSQLVAIPQVNPQQTNRCGIEALLVQALQHHRRYGAEGIARLCDSDLSRAAKKKNLPSFCSIHLYAQDLPPRRTIQKPRGLNSIAQEWLPNFRLPPELGLDTEEQGISKSKRNLLRKHSHAVGIHNRQDMILPLF
mmetsp:Transcript_7422/g.17647  ORF Transcript_7422/g.17647 Transcript_7422/m.17647 type:complete len:206 (-) Transcript_7422:1045-1662(-)